MIVQNSSGNSQLWSSGISAGWVRPTFMVRGMSFTQSRLVTVLNHIYKGRSRLVFEWWLGASAWSLHGNETATGCRHSHPSFGYCLRVMLLDEIDNLMSLNIVCGPAQELYMHSLVTATSQHFSRWWKKDAELYLYKRCWRGRHSLKNGFLILSNFF